MKKYKLVSKKGEGTFSEVVKAENIEDGKFYAIKCMKNSFKSLQQVNNLREVQALRKLAPHPNIIDLEEVLFDEPTGRLAMVFELMEANLYDLISGRREHLDTELVRNIGYQMFVALKYMHDKSIFHRDIKPENILIDKSGKTLKLADFGSCRSVHSKPPFTEYIATRWYRSPECLLTEGFYGAPMDIWGAGCVLFEIISLFPLFPGADEVDQVNRIHKVVGTPTGEILAKLKKHKSSKIDFKFRAQNGVGIKHFIPHASVECVNLLTQTLEYDFGKRIGSAEACSHEYFGALRGDVKKKIDPTKKRPTQRVNGKEARNEKSTLRRKKQQQTGEITEEKPKVKKFVRAEKKQPYTRNNIAKPKPKPKPKPCKPKANKPKPSRLVNTKPVDSKVQPTNKTSRVKEPRRTKRPLNDRLPKLNKNTEGGKKISDSASAGSKPKETSKPGITTRRKNKYANITSSGYGKTKTVPSKTSNPSAASNLTDKTSKTTTSGSTYLGSKSSSDDSMKPLRTGPHVRKLRMRNEKTVTNFPIVR